MSVTNHTASAVNLAKSYLMSLDRTKADTTIPTATLELLLKTLLDVADDQNNAGMKIAEGRSKSVASHLAAVGSAVSDRGR